MKSTDFNLHLQKFFTVYLRIDEGHAQLTIDSYSKTFALFLKYLRDYEHILVEEMTISRLTREVVEGFLRYLAEVRHNSAATRKQRKAAIVSFVQYLRYEVSTYQQQYDAILAIRIKTPVNQAPVFLSAEGLQAFVDAVLEEPRHKLRNLVLISLMAGAGLRCSEVLNLRPKDIQLGTPASLVVTGKGNKKRAVPLQESLRKTLGAYLKQTGLEHPARREEYLFKNLYGRPLTRYGLYHIVTVCADRARLKHPDLIPAEVSPHTLRHTFATLNIAKGVDLIYIRDLLGHSSVQTTEHFYIGQYKKVREANAVSESIAQIVDGENIATSEKIEPPEEDTLNFLKNLTKRRTN